MISVKNKTKESADAYIYEEITSFDLFGGTSCKGFKDEIEALGPIKHLNLFINSPGGDVFEGLAIANFLKRQKFDIDVYIDGIAASIASAVAIGCGGRVHMYDSSIIMVHKAWCNCGGNADELRKIADQIDECDKSIFSMYKDAIKGKITDEELQEMIKAETWLDAAKCLEIGFCFDIIQDDRSIAAKISPEYCSRYINIPKNLISEEAPTHNAELKKEELPEDIKEIIASAEHTLKALDY